MFFNYAEPWSSLTRTLKLLRYQWWKKCMQYKERSIRSTPTAQWIVNSAVRHEKNKQKYPAFAKKCAKCGKENDFTGNCKANPGQRWREKREYHLNGIFD